MDPLAIAAVYLGAMIVLVRGPLVLWPIATVAWYRRLLRTNPRIRGLAAAIAAPAALVLSSEPRNGVGEGMRYFAAVLGALSIWLLAAPASYRRVALEKLRAVEDPAVLRVLGALGVAVGVIIVWTGIAVLQP